MRFGVGEFAGLAVEGSRAEFRATFRAEPTKAVQIVPFQEASAEQVQQNFAAIKAQVRAIVGGEVGPAQEVQAFAIAKKEPAEQPAQGAQDFAIVKKEPIDQAPNTSEKEGEDDPSKW